MTRSRVKAGSKVGRALQRDLKALGYTLEHRGTKHVVIAPDGAIVRKANGVPLTLANSPSTRNADVNMRHACRECGIPLPL